MGLGPGRAPRSNRAERQLDGADTDDVTVNEPCGRVQTPIGDERAVLTAKILDRRVLSSDSDQRMAAGDTRRVEEELEVRIATQHVLAFAKARTAIRPNEAKADVLRLTVVLFAVVAPAGSRNA